MPRSRPKRVPCDCFDCRDLQPSGPQQQVEAAAWRAAALQDPPPKCLILFLDAPQPATAQRLVGALDAAEPVHVHAIACEGCSGFLAMRQGTQGPHRQCAALAQLLGMHKEQSDNTLAGWPSMGDRYKGMAAGMTSNCPEAIQLGQRAGLSCLPLEPAGVNGLPAPAGVVTQLAQRLGIGLPEQQLAALSDSDDDLDMLLLHISTDVAAASPSSTGGRAEEHACDGQDVIAWLDEVVKGVNALHSARDGLLLVLLLAAGPHFKPTPAEARPLGLPGYPTVRRPVQSYEFAGLERIAVDEQRSVMLTQRLRGVLRCDSAQCFTAVACARGAAGGMLLERLLPELAYKMGRASKYGA